MNKVGGPSAYALKRILQTIPLVLVLIVFNFVLVHIAPGDPATYLAGAVFVEIVFSYPGMGLLTYESIRR